MVAYSFRQRFVEPILAGTKRQTIRATGKRRHAYAGNSLELYFGMRTKCCRLIARARCEDTIKITLDWGLGLMWLEAPGEEITDDFARRDGFLGRDDMRDFWRKHHPGEELFEGLLISWGDIHD